jgi:polar amino acid transport system permease protein
MPGILHDSELRQMLGAVAGLLLVLWLLPVPLALLPPPIGPAARLFGDGARMTALLTLAAGLFGLAIGIVVGLARLAKSKPVRQAASFYVWVIRGTPLITQILFVYFALPALLPQLELSDFWSAVLALSINVGAYNGEIIRAGIQAVPAGQTEAARALGLRSIQLLRLVVLPQALRICLPPLVNNVVALLKDSSLAYVIGVVELSLVGNRIQAESFRPIPIFITVAGVYLAMTTFLTAFSHALEARLSRNTSR